PDAEPGDLRLDTVPDRLRATGDPAADIDERPGSLDRLLDLARRDEEGGLGDAPWPPHFPKARGEPKRVQPSRDRDRPTHRGRAHFASVEPTWIGPDPQSIVAMYVKACSPGVAVAVPTLSPSSAAAAIPAAKSVRIIESFRSSLRSARSRGTRCFARPLDTDM